jgi:thioredoxin reductase
MNPTNSLSGPSSDPQTAPHVAPPSAPVSDPTMTHSDEGPVDGLASVPVAVIGAGPIGLAAAAHLHDRGIPFVLFELGDDVAASVREWGHVQLFSSWDADVDPVARRLLEANGWNAPIGDGCPTGAELIERYLEPLSMLPAIGGALRTNRLITGVTRAGTDKLTSSGRSRTPFLVTAEGPHGIERTLAGAVIDATGTWLTPNPVGADGRPAVGERQAEDRIEQGIPDVLGRDRRRFAKRRIAVVGAGHSAQNVVRDLAVLVARAPGTDVTWIVRRSEPRTTLGDIRHAARHALVADADAAVDAGAIRRITGFRTDRIIDGSDGVRLVATDDRVVGPFDRIVNATGFRPDMSMSTELRLDLDPILQSARALAPIIDPEQHSFGSVPTHGVRELAHPEPGLYVVGSKSYGRAPTFLLSTGYEQVRSVVAELASHRAVAVSGAAPSSDPGLDAGDGGPSSAQPEAAGACCS